MDRFSGWLHVVASTSSAKDFITALINYFATFGVPEELSTDSGPDFTAAIATPGCCSLQLWVIRVLLQNQTGNHSKRWNRTAVVTETKPYDQGGRLRSTEFKELAGPAPHSRASKNQPWPSTHPQIIHKMGGTAKTEYSTSRPQGRGLDLTPAPGSDQPQARIQNEASDEEAIAPTPPKAYKAPVPPKA
ncbi:hypothetical protein SK128_025347 [Halocaridina rubra]|uniref:Uncharacterized protein n=1 Tax=Halocaridina rubra TaxID=373956 RepID=A0AAN9AF44_HALRR